MRVALAALLLAGAFLAGVLAGVSAPDEPGTGAPAAIRVSAAAAPSDAGLSSSPSSAPRVERIQREVEYDPIESYEDDGGGSNSGSGSDSSGPGSGDSGSDSSGPGSDDSGSGSSGPGSSGSDSSGEGS
jgi:hypothetical protein